MVLIQCPTCNAETRFSLVQSKYEGPFRCWKCRGTFVYTIENEEVRLCKSITEREKRMIQMRFGLIDGRTRTLEEAGREFNVTRERARQMEGKALAKLRHPSRSRKLKEYLE